MQCKGCSAIMRNNIEKSNSWSSLPIDSRKRHDSSGSSELLQTCCDPKRVSETALWCILNESVGIPIPTAFAPGCRV